MNYNFAIQNESLISLVSLAAVFLDVTQRSKKTAARETSPDLAFFICENKFRIWSRIQGE